MNIKNSLCQKTPHYVPEPKTNSIFLPNKKIYNTENGIILTVLFTTLLSLGFTPVTPLIQNKGGTTLTNLLSNYDATSASSTKAPYATGCAGTTWYNLFNTSNNATVATCGTGWTGTGTAASPRAYTFNGSTDRITAGTLLTGSAQAALEAWVKPASATASGTVIMGNGGGIGNGLAIRQSISPVGRYELTVGQGFIASHDYRNLVMSYSPVGYWRLGESSGTSAADLSVTANPGTYAGTTLAQTGAISGDANTGITLTGTSTSYVNIPTNAAYDLTSGAMALWFKANGAQSGGATILARADAASSGNGFTFTMGSTGRITLQLKAGVTGLINSTTTNGYADGNWHFLVYNFSQANGGSNILYVDGVNVISSTPSAWSFNNSAVRMGVSLDSFWGKFNGSLDELAIFPTQLTQAQVTALYTNTGGAYSSYIVSEAPVSYWHLNETSGTTASDVMRVQNLTYDSSVTLNNLTGPIKGAGDTSPLFTTGSSWAGAKSDSIATPLRLTGALSYEAWIYPTSLGGYPIIRMDNGSNQNNLGFFIGNPSGALQVQQFSSDYFNLFSTGTLTANKWQHVVVTRSAAGTDFIFYINGISAGSGTLAAPSVTPIKMAVGGTPSSTVGFQGNLAEVAVYNTTLTAQQVRAHYQRGIAQLSNTVLADGPLGYWRMSEPNGVTAYDLSGNGNNGTYSASGVTLGQTGPLTEDSSTAATFDGSAGQVILNNTVQFDTGPLSIEAWFKTSSVAAYDREIWMGGIGSGGSVTLLGFDGNNDLQALVRDFAGNYTNLTKSGFNNGIWHHAVATKDSSLSALYVDGTLVASASSTAVTGDVDTAAILPAIGNGHAPYTTRYFPGSIAEVAVYNYALSQAQVTSHYNSGFGSSWWVCQSRTPISTTTWNLLDAIWNGTTASLIVNGQQECSVTPGTTYSGSGSFVIGTDNVSTSTSYWSGSLAWLRSFVASSGAVLTQALAWSDFNANANRFRATPIIGIVQSGLVLHLDAANTLNGTAPAPSGCASVNLNWMDLSSSILNATLSFNTTCGSTLGWNGDGTGSTPYRLVLNGAFNGYATIPYNAALNPAKFTAEIWLKSEGGAGTFRTPLTSRNPTPNATGYNLYAGNNNLWQAWIGNGGSGGSGWSIVQGSAVTSYWTHLVETYDGTTLKLYLNGTTSGTPLNTNMALNTSHPTLIGIGDSAASYNWNGSIAVVRIYNRALAAGEIVKNCNAQKSRFSGASCVAP